MKTARSLLVLSSSFALAASAQTPPVIHLDDVVVQGHRLTDSAATVTRVELDSLPDQMATTSALSARAANFFVARNDARSFNDTFALRGLTNTPIFGDPAITFYLDDLPLGSGFTFPTDLAGFARAELHRGPTQNTVFGRAGSAGVVTLATPDLGAQPAAELRASVGNYDARRVSLSVGTASGGAADAWVNAGYATRAGYITNTQLARDIDAKDARSALARVRVRPTSTTELTLLVTALRARDGVQPLVPLGGPMFTVTRNGEGETALDAWNAALTAAVRTPLGRLALTSSAGNWDLAPYSSTLAFGPMELANNVTQRQRHWSEELKFSGDANAAQFWQVGGFYSDDRTDGSFERIFGPYPFERSRFRVDARSLAAFGETTRQLAPKLHITAGLRLEDSRKTMHRVESVPASQAFDLRRESSAWLPKLGVSYAPDSSTKVFATAGAGYKPGGFSAFTGNRALAAFGPERTKTLEAGATRLSADKKFSATVRGFLYDIAGYQIERSFATSSVADDYLVVNAARARSFGAESELAWSPFPAVTLAADLGATNVTLREFTDPYTGVSYAGKRAPAVPNYDASFRASYRHEGGFFAGAEWSANGNVFYTEGEDPAFEQRACALLSARTGFARGRFTITAFCDNLTDRRYYSAITPGTGHGTPGAPRTYGIELVGKW